MPWLPAAWLMVALLLGFWLAAGRLLTGYRLAAAYLKPNSWLLPPGGCLAGGCQVAG